MQSRCGLSAWAVLLFCCEGAFCFYGNTTTNIQERYSRVRFLPLKTEVKSTVRPLFYWESLPTSTYSSSLLPSPSKLPHTDDALLKVIIPISAPKKGNKTSKEGISSKSEFPSKKNKAHKGAKNRKRKQKRKNKKRKNRKPSNLLRISEAGKNVTVPTNDSFPQGSDPHKELAGQAEIRHVSSLEPQSKNLESAASLFDTTASAVTEGTRKIRLKSNERKDFDLKANRPQTFLINETAGDAYITNKTQQSGRCSRENGGCAHICSEIDPKPCSCLEGFVLGEDEKRCVDINECSTNNGGCKNQCHNTWGSFYCGCPAGLRIGGDLKSCEDVNECLLRNSHGPCEDTCTNTFGSYLCSCSNLTGTRLSADNHSCEDINECKEGQSGCSHGCINTHGRAFCTCPDGMELGSDWKTCNDINECETDEVKKQCKYGCQNVVGSYHCLGLREEQNDQVQVVPELISCPPLFPPKHGFYRCSRKRAAVSNFRTKSGRDRVTNRPGTFCELSCPPGLKITHKFRVFCSLNGTWVGRKTGKCIPIPQPEIRCPDLITTFLKGEDKLAHVTFPSPKANVSWKFIESEPPWAKKLEAYLPEGRHNFTFKATDPINQLSDKCLIHIVVKKLGATKVDT